MASLSLPPPRKSIPQHPSAAAGAASLQDVVHSDDDDDHRCMDVDDGGDKTTTTNNVVAGARKKSPPPNNNAKNNNKPRSNKTIVPSYEERCGKAAAVSKMSKEQRRANPSKAKLFVPRALTDFGDDGGAFPEIHVAQYPRHMGNPHLKRTTKGSSGGSSGAGAGQGQSQQVVRQSTSRAIVNVEIDKDGDVSYDAIIKGGTNSDKIVYTRHADLRGGNAAEEDIALPSEQEEQDEASKTNAALMALLATKTAHDKPTSSAMAHAETSKNIEEKTQFIKYTPNPDAPGYNPDAAKQRVIQMVPAQIDPMMPPKHKHVKAPRGPAEDPVPILQGPPPKLTKEEREAWNIPACISNWKNTRGYTIPLDKRLAADGRGLRDHTINSNFATFAESLYVAEKQARQEVRSRAHVQKQFALQEKEKRESELRDLANQARIQRSGGGGALAAVQTLGDDDSDDDDDASSLDEASHDNNKKNGEGAAAAASHRGGVAVVPTDADQEATTEDDVAAQQRERLRMERRKDRERELRIEQNAELKKKRRLEEERDVSEKIALGTHTGTGGELGDGIDSRLYNQSAGMDSGFGADDEYNMYSKPLFGNSGGASSAGSASIYRPTRGENALDADDQYDKLTKGKGSITSKFQPDKGFGGAEGGMDVTAGPRTAPVQFEKSQK